VLWVKIVSVCGLCAGGARLGRQRAYGSECLRWRWKRGVGAELHPNPPSTLHRLPEHLKRHVELGTGNKAGSVKKRGTIHTISIFIAREMRHPPIPSTYFVRTYLRACAPTSAPLYSYQVYRTHTRGPHLQHTHQTVDANQYDKEEAAVYQFTGVPRVVAYCAVSRLAVDTACSRSSTSSRSYSSCFVACLSACSRTMSSSSQQKSVSQRIARTLTAHVGIGES
jgi:hypothetical protein